MTTTIIGYFITISSSNGRWTLKSKSEGKEYKGDAPKDLQVGKVIASQLYKLKCTMKIEKVTLDAKEKEIYYIKEIEVI